MQSLRLVGAHGADPERERKIIAFMHQSDTFCIQTHRVHLLWFRVRQMNLVELYHNNFIKTAYLAPAKNEKEDAPMSL